VNERDMRIQRCTTPDPGELITLAWFGNVCKMLAALPRVTAPSSEHSHGVETALSVGWTSLNAALNLPTSKRRWYE
jgi:hypothetical protein